MASIDYTLPSPQWFAAAVTKSNKISKLDSNYYMNQESKSMGDSSDHCQSSRRRSTLAKMVGVPKKTKKSLKPVKFDEGEHIVHQLDPSSDKDREQVWFSKQEIRALRQEGRDILDKVNGAGGDLSTLDETMGESIRGLEHGLSVFDHDSGWHTLNEDGDTAPLDRSERRKNIVNTILAQQHEHHEAGIDDPKGLQVTSKACTQWARDRAFDQALKDFDDAVEVWQEDSECAKLLPSIRSKKSRRQSVRRSSVVSVGSNCQALSAEEREATLDTISKTVASALEELDDLDF